MHGRIGSVKRPVTLLATIILAAHPVTAQIPETFANADALLEALETADEGLDTFNSKIELVDDAGHLEGNQITKKRGRVYLELERDDSGERIGTAFRVDFEYMRIADDEPGRWIQRDYRQSYVFDGRQLLELQHDVEQAQITDIRGPNNRGDPLRIGEGPFPLPIGQLKEAITARFESKLLDAGDSLKILPPELEETVQLHLVPHPATQEARDYQEIRVWYVRHDADGDGTADFLLPRMARTVHVDGAREDVRLVRERVNASLDPSIFDIAAPAGWEVNRRPFQPPSPQPVQVIPQAQQSVRPTDRSDDATDELIEPAAAPDLSPGLLRRLEAEYLTDEEGATLRVFHGVGREEDFDTIERAAQAALYRGVFNDIALDMTSSIEDRAEAQLRAGNAPEALELLHDPESVRALRLRVEAHEMLGDHVRAAAEAAEAARVVEGRSTPATADEVVDVVRMLNIRARIAGSDAGAQDYRSMMSMLGRVRTQQDAFHWPARLAEAELLFEKDNRSAASEALVEVLSLNPQAADAWLMLGRMAVDSFGFAQAEGIAMRLDKMYAESGDQHPYGAIIRARARLRQRDAIGAAEALAPAIAEYPTMRELLALQAATEAARFYYRRVESLLQDFDELSPNSPVALHTVGATLSEARQYEAAASYLNRAHERQPNWAQPLIDLGLLEMQSGRDLEAIDALEKAFELDPFNIRADNSLRLARELRGYSTVESDNFIVRFRPGIDEVLAHDMLAPLEESHVIVAEAFDHEPNQKTVIELLPDHQWFGVRIAGMPQIHTIAASTGPVIAMEAPRDGPKHLGTYDWVRTLRHEYAHTVTLSRTKNRIPHWFTEAAAVYVELAPRDYDRCSLLATEYKNDNLFDLDEINIAFVRPKRPQDRSQAYAQGHWMYEFIVETWGPRAPLELMDLYAEGTNEAEAFERVLSVEREQFMQRFLAWARQQIIDWGMLLEDDVPTLQELLVQEALNDETRRSAILDQLADTAEFADWIGTTGADITGDPDFAIHVPLMTPPMLDRWREDYPDHPEVLAAAVTAALNERDGKADLTMVPLLEAYADARPVDPLPHRLLAQMYLDGSLADTAKAIEHLEFLDARETRKPTYAAALSKRYAKIGDLDTASQKAERATQVAPYDADYRTLAAEAAMRTKDLQTARRHILALTKLEPRRDIHRRRLEAIDARLNR